MRVFFVYAILLAFFICFAYYLLQFNSSKELLFLTFKFYILVEYSLLGFFFTLLIINKTFKKIILFSILPFIFFCIYRYVILPNDKFDNLPSLVEFSFFIIVISFYFYERMKIVTSNPSYNKISYWLVIGLFTYFAGNFFYYLMLTTTNNLELIKQMKFVTIIVNITKDIILSLAWFAHERTETDADILTIPDGLGLDDDLPINPTTNS